MGTIGNRFGSVSHLCSFTDYMSSVFNRMILREAINWQLCVTQVSCVHLLIRRLLFGLIW